jgi:hypothetical protein
MRLSVTSWNLGQQGRALQATGGSFDETTEENDPSTRGPDTNKDANNNEGYYYKGTNHNTYNLMGRPSWALRLQNTNVTIHTNVSLLLKHFMSFAKRMDADFDVTSRRERSLTRAPPPNPLPIGRRVLWLTFCGLGFESF